MMLCLSTLSRDSKTHDVGMKLFTIVSTKGEEGTLKDGSELCVKFLGKADTQSGQLFVHPTQ